MYPSGCEVWSISAERGASFHEVCGNAKSQACAAFPGTVSVSRQVCPFSLWQAIETGLMVAKEHKNVVEGLVVGRLAETRARRGLAILLERDDAN
jgi:hypothetical protein